MTNDLLGRVEAHREGRGSKITSRYHLKLLVIYEPFADIEAAIQREKTLKKICAAMEDQPDRARKPELV